MTDIVVAGYMIRHPLAGNLFAFLHYVLGLHRLGYRVTYVEESGWPNACYDPFTGSIGDDPRAGFAAVRGLLQQVGCPIPTFYVNRETGSVAGGTRDDVQSALAAADLLLNIGGVNWLPEFGRCRCLALIDMDPLFTQVGRFAVEQSDAYHAYFTYGANIGKPGCTVPTAGVNWHPTVPPVVLDLWQPGSEGTGDRFTTVASWGAYGATTYQGVEYGQKDREFLRVLDLPSRTSQPLEITLAGVDAAAKNELRTAGWYLRGADEVTHDISTYCHYISSSRGEFSVAKHAYVATRSGWFSDRSVCYLAAGRPTVLQDTGFTDWLPAGSGVVPFSTVVEAAEGLERVARDYRAHSAAARDIAERVFSHEVVLTRLVEIAIDSRTARSASAGGLP